MDCYFLLWMLVFIWVLSTAGLLFVIYHYHQSLAEWVQALTPAHYHIRKNPEKKKNQIGG